MRNRFVNSPSALRGVATLLSWVLVASAPVEAQKARIAVSPFADRSGEQTTTTGTARVGMSAGQTTANVGTKGDLGGQVADAIITELVKLGRYDIVERVELEKVISEQKLKLAGLDDMSKASEAARILGADLMITGSITEAASSRTGKGYVVFKKKELVGRVVLDSRLIDVKTTKAIWGATNEGIESLISKKIMGVGKDDMAGVQLLLGKAARKAANEFVRQVVPVLDQSVGRRTGDSVLETAATLRDTNVFLPIGSKVGVITGQRFDLFVLGDPFTVGGKTIREPLKIGTVVIDHVQPEYSRGPAPETLLGLTKMSLDGLTARRSKAPPLVSGDG